MVLDIIKKTLREYNLLNNGRQRAGRSFGRCGFGVSYSRTLVAEDEFDIKLYTALINHGIRGEEAKRDELFA